MVSRINILILLIKPIFSIRMETPQGPEDVGWISNIIQTSTDLTNTCWIKSLKPSIKNN